MNETKITSAIEEEVSEKTPKLQRRFWGTIAFSSVLLLISIYFAGYLWQQPHTTASYLGIAIFLIAVVVSVISILLSVRQRQLLGLQLVFLFLNIFGIAMGGLFQGRTLSGSFTILFLSALMIFSLFPRKSWLSAAIVPIVAFSIMWIIEWLNPAWRVPFVAPEVGPEVVVGFGLFLLIFTAFQVRNFINRSLRLRITLWSGVTVFILSTVLVTYSALSGRQVAIQAAQDDSLQHAYTGAGTVRTRLETPLATARAFAEALSAVKDPNSGTTLTRDQVDAMLRHILIENPSYLGTYTLWEPNAFDGLDAEFRNTVNSDETGRFIPYWIRGDDGSISVVPLEQYETPGIGDWYILPRQNKVEMTFAPLIYPINGVDTVMASFVVPIVEDNNFYGIAGVDAPISFVQELVDSVDLYNGTAEAILLTSSGTLIGVGQRPDLTNQFADQMFPDFAELQARIEAGEPFISLSPDGNYLRSFAPVDLGRTGQHWAYSLIIPFSEITAPATQAAITQIGISTILIALALFLLWVLTGRIVRPLLALTDVANAISEGDLERRAAVTSSDEVGLLATTFNAMTTQLQETLQGLEQRVAERTRALETSAEVSRRLSTILDLNQLLKEVVDQIQQAFDYYHAHIYLFDDERNRFVMAGGTGEAGRTMLANNHAIPAGRGLVGRAGETNQVVLVPVTTADPNWLPNPLLPETKSEVAVPISIGQTVLGVLDVQHNVENGIKQEDANLLQAIANQVAIALQNARSYSQTQKRAEQEARIARVGQRIQNAATMEEVLKVALKELGQSLGARRAVVQIGQSVHNGNQDSHR